MSKASGPVVAAVALVAVAAALLLTGNRDEPPAPTPTVTPTYVAPPRSDAFWRGFAQGEVDARRGWTDQAFECQDHPVYGPGDWWMGYAEGWSSTCFRAPAPESYRSVAEEGAPL